MKAVILAGGLGTRISEETSVRPKSMVENMKFAQISLGFVESSDINSQLLQ